MSKPTDRKALGKGLSALLPAKSQLRSSVTQEQSPTSGLQQIAVDLIDPSPVQPRTVFDAERLAELAQSIRANGIIQPLVVRRAGDRYQLVAGERRWRASKLAGLSEVPVVIQEFASNRLLEIALIENIQREDLNAIEVAHALNRLAMEHHLSHDEIGQRTGKDRSSVSNLVRLLNSPEEVQLLVAERRIGMGHARALLAITDEEKQVELANRAAAQGLSVRQVERLVQGLTVHREPEADAGKTEKAKPDPNVVAATRELEATLGTRVRIVSQSPERGRIEIDYFSAEELDRIYNLIVNGE